MEILLVFIFVMGLITIVGHGIWCMLAAMFRAISGNPNASVGERRRGCPRCHALLTNPHHCEVCQWPMHVHEAAAPEKALQALLRQAARFLQLGVISQAVFNRWRRQLIADPEVSAQTQAEKAPTHTSAAQPFAEAPSQQQEDDVLFIDETVEILDDEPEVASPEPSTQQPPTAPATPAAPLAPQPMPGPQPVTTSESVPSAPADPTIVASVAQPTQAEFQQATLPLVPRGGQVAPNAQPHQMAHAPVHAAPAQSAHEPPKQHDTFMRLAYSFMEERNIRWGELVGGLLIVCCSIALVISFWSHIAERPFLKFFVFNGVTAALFGVGFYTERRWKLETTSRGLLIIATLLVPLNFLAIAAIANEAAGNQLITLSGEALSFVFFGAMVYFAGCIITPGRDRWLTFGVMASALCELLMRRFVHPEIGTLMLNAIGFVPIAVYLASSTGLLFSARHSWQEGDPVDEPSVHGVLSCLGIVSFATLLPLGLLCFKFGDTWQVLHQSALLVACLGMPALGIGTWMWQRLTQPQLATQRTIASAVGVFGSCVVLSSLVLAWPHALNWSIAATFSGIAFVFLGFRLRFAAVHPLGLICITAALVVFSHMIFGGLSPQSDSTSSLLAALNSTTSCFAMIPLCLGMIAGGWSLRRAGRMDDANAFGATTLLLSVVSLTLITVHGTAAQISWVYLIFAFTALNVSVLTQRAFGAWVGAGLLLFSVANGVGWEGLVELRSHGWAATLLIHATACLLAACFLRRIRVTDGTVPALWQAATISLTAMVIPIFAENYVSALALAGLFVWCAALWFLVAHTSARLEFGAVFQLSLGISCVFGVLSLFESSSWYAEPGRFYADARFYQAVAITLAAYGLIWTGIRLGTGWLTTESWQLPEASHDLSFAERCKQFMASPFSRVDQLTVALSLVVLLMLVFVAVIPGITQELNPIALVEVDASAEANAEVTRTVTAIDQLDLGIGRQHAQGFGTWALMLVIGIAVVTGLWQRTSPWRALALIVVVWSVAPLLATRFESAVSTASALRWLSTGIVLLLAVPVWLRDKWSWLPTSLGWKLSSHTDSLVRDSRALLVFLAAAPMVLMGIGTALVALQRAPAPGNLVAAAVAGCFAWAFVCAGGAAVVIAYLQQRRIAGGHGETGRETHPTESRGDNTAKSVGIVAAMLAFSPVVVVFMFLVARALMIAPITGVEPQSLFGEMGTAASYSVPVFVLATILVGFGIRERLPLHAFSAGLLLNLASTGAFLIAVATAGRSLDGFAWIQVAQVNAIVTAVFTLLWNLFWVVGRRGQQLPKLLLTQLAFGICLCVSTLAPAMVLLIIRPWSVALAGEAGSLMGWIGIGLMGAATHWTMRQTPELVLRSRWLGSWTALAVSVLLALTMCQWDDSGWRAFHFLLVALTLCSSYRVVVACAGRAALRVQDYSWTAIVAAVSFALAWRALAGHAEQGWWTVSVLGFLSFLSIAVTSQLPNRVVPYLSSVLATLAAMVWWFVDGSTWLMGDLEYELLFHSQFLTIALAAPALLWMAIDRYLIGESEDQSVGIGVHRLVALFSLLTLATSLVVGFDAGASMSLVESSLALTIGSFVVVTIAVLACMWDRNAIGALVGTLALGGLYVALALDAFGYVGSELFWQTSAWGSVYLLVVASLWKGRSHAAPILVGLGIKLSSGKVQLGHLSLVILAVIFGMLTALSGVSFQFELVEFPRRLIAASALALMALTWGLIAHGETRRFLQFASLILGMLASVTIAWSFLSPESLSAELLPVALVHRTVLITLSLVLCALLYGSLGRFIAADNDWQVAIGGALKGIIGIVLVSVGVVMAGEIHWFLSDIPVPIHWAAMVVQGAALGMIVFITLTFALLPDRDPLGLTGPMRQAYVYAAEVALALLFFHIRIAMPWLFAEWFQPYWPLAVMGVAFAGVGISELFRKQQMDVLSEPLRNTGVVLPILPVLGFWVLRTTQVHYSLLLLSAGALYAMVSVMRKSFLFAMVAVVASNASLWFVLSDMDGLGFLAHPQLWVIPPAVCALIASYLNAKSLSEEQFIGIRYFSALAIYSSSTADVFINGVGQAPWLPLVLGGLAVFGVLSGILMRVRGFLYLGVSFLMIDLLTIIWYAAVDLEQTWVWAVCGIITGILIIALFAFFELKRDRVYQFMNEMRSWDA